MTHIFENRRFAINDVENLRLHYARTLSDWHLRYEDYLDEIRGDFDEHFIRAWRLYLVGSMAAFTTGQLQLFQVTFNRERSNQLPWSRSHLYQNELHGQDS
jgi:cyclopropane-fatty-acyl-phospholipid synthase